MADIKLNIKGDASGATDALKQVGTATEELSKKTEEQAKASEISWKSIAAGAAAAAAAVAAFGASSVKAYADAERVTAQLKRAAGEYADALDEQAQAMSRVYAVDDDVIKQSQILLTQWGGVAAASTEAEKAALNLSVAMGVDLDTATRALIKNVETGGSGLAKFGVEFEATGDKGKDFAAAVGAINEKLGGAAEADAQSLSGQLRSAGLALDDFKKAFGEFIVQSSAGAKALEYVKEALAGWRAFMEGDTQTQAVTNMQKLHERRLAAAESLKMQTERLQEAEVQGWKQVAQEAAATIALEKERLAIIQKEIAAENLRAGGVSSMGAITGTTTKGASENRQAEAEAKRHNEAVKKLLEENAANFRKYQKDVEAMDDSIADKEEKTNERRLKEDADFAVRMMASEQAVLDSRFEAEAKYYEKQEAERERMRERQEKDELRRVEHMKQRQAEAWQRAGDEIGAAFVNGLAAQIQKLAEGEEFDVETFVGSILAATFAIAATAIASAYGQPALGAAIGNLGAAGIQAGFGALKKDRLKRQNQQKRHSGGWIGDENYPRHHEGSWIGEDEQVAILQHGERVLSRQEVGRMGGPRDVDAVARGGRGGGITVNIQAIDTKSAAESFETSLGRGLRRALKSGRGDMGAILGAR